MVAFFLVVFLLEVLVFEEGFAMRGEGFSALDVETEVLDWAGGSAAAPLACEGTSFLPLNELSARLEIALKAAASLSDSNAFLSPSSSSSSSSSDASSSSSSDSSDTSSALSVASLSS